MGRAGEVRGGQGRGGQGRRGQGRAGRHVACSESTGMRVSHMMKITHMAHGMSHMWHVAAAVTHNMPCYVWHTDATHLFCLLHLHLVMQLLHDLTLVRGPVVT